MDTTNQPQVIPPHPSSGKGGGGDDDRNPTPQQKETVVVITGDESPENDLKGSDSSSDLPHGIRQMEAITSVWNQKWLYAAYAMIWIISFTNSLQQQANYSWTPYVTSSFQLHGLTAATSIVSGVVSGVIKFPLAKIIDIVGRPQGFFFMLSLTVISLVLMAVCPNVETYAAAQVFYWSGLNGMDYVLDMFINDTSTLRNRSIALAFTTTPFICNTFAGPALGETFLNRSSWRWGYGAFAIITPFMCLPFWTIFAVLRRRVDKSNFEKAPSSGRSWQQSIVHYATEFDVIGLVLICGGFSIFLLPFSLASYQADGWASPMIICMIVFGIVLLILFALWERFLAPKSVLPFHLLTNRSVIAACLITCNLFISSYVHTMYFSSYLQVVFQMSVSQAGWINNLYNLVSCAWAVPLTIAIRYADRFKWVGYICVPGQILMTGLMIEFRQPYTAIGLVIMVKILWAIFSASLISFASLGLMSAISHEHLAIAIALQSMVTSIGGSVGQTISGAMWTQLVPSYLEQYLPDDMKNQTALIYGSLPTQLSYPWDSPVRQAIVQAYGDAYRLMLIAATALLAPLIVWVLITKDYKLSEHKNLKGVLF